MVPVDEFERFLVYWTVSLSQMFAKLKDRRNGQTDGWPNGLSSRRLIMKQINLNGKIKLIRCFSGRKEKISKMSRTVETLVTHT